MAGNKSLRVKVLVLVLLLSPNFRAVAAEPPAPYGPIPTADQLAWQDMEQYGFVHFGMNTFTSQEWGNGDEDPKTFKLEHFDADQIAATFEKAGLKGLILVVKHHDGFCLWPTAYTKHSIKYSPYKNGEGDLVREMSDACAKHHLKFGIYLSPWDRNNAAYGTPAYVEIFRNELKELLTNYGPIFEVWFDGANGGDGYYGGARGKRTIDPLTYYGWDETFKLIRELQPHAIIWSPTDAITIPADVRWVGNESGHGAESSYAVVTRLAGGVTGSWWMPPEADVSIRPGWFYHQDQDLFVKTPARLVHLSFDTVGHSTNLLLNIPASPQGEIDRHDVEALEGWKELTGRIFARDLAKGASATADNVRGNDPQFAASHVIDGKAGTYWATDDGVTTAALTLDLGKPTTFNVIQLQEYIPLGQRIEGIVLDAWTDGQWKEFATASTVGHQRLIVVKDTTTSKVRVRVTKTDACPALSGISLYNSPYPILEESGLR
jgi:alpha-L-fucosidase